MIYGWSFNPIDSAPAVIGIIVGFFVWLRHRADRRARVFLALAASEMLLGVPLALAASTLPEGLGSVALAQGLVLTAGLLSMTLFVHFAFAFPHARPWIRRGRIKYLYAFAILAGAAMTGATLTLGSDESRMSALDTVMIGTGVLVIAGCIAAFLAILQSYREMTKEERERYRVPVLGIAAALVLGFAADVLVALLFEFVSGLDSRAVLWTVNLLSVASELLFPLFFFMAASKYKLLEHHAQDYVAKL